MKRVFEVTGPGKDIEEWLERAMDGELTVQEVELDEDWEEVVCMEAKLTIQKGSRDYRDGTCSVCQKDCLPRVRFWYYSAFVQDKYGNTAIDGEFETCESCAKKKGWKFT